MLVLDRAVVADLLDMPRAIALVREAMTALSAGETRQALRSIVELDDGNAFDGSMVAAVVMDWSAVPLLIVNSRLLPLTLDR